MPTAALTSRSSSTTRIRALFAFWSVWTFTSPPSFAKLGPTECAALPCEGRCERYYGRISPGQRGWQRDSYVLPLQGALSQGGAVVVSRATLWVFWPMPRALKYCVRRSPRASQREVARQSSEDSNVTPASQSGRPQVATSRPAKRMDARDVQTPPDRSSPSLSRGVSEKSVATSRWGTTLTSSTRAFV